MKVNKDFLQLINRIEEGHLYTAEECAFLLSFPETSLEAAITRGVADRLSRVKYCINRANWKMAQYLMSEFFGQLFPEKKERCCE